MDMTLLPVDYVPGNNDVLLGRGKDIFAHNANKRFRIMIQETMETYGAAPTKADKTLIIRDIVSRVKKIGGFVAYDHIAGRYYKVGRKKAHEKTSQAFRDMWYSVCKSSSATKLRRRRKDDIASSCRLPFSSEGTCHPGSIETVGSDRPSSNHPKPWRPNYELSKSACFSPDPGIFRAPSQGNPRSFHACPCDPNNVVDNVFRESGLQDDMSAILRFCYKENEDVPPEPLRTSSSPGWTTSWKPAGMSTLEEPNDVNIHQDLTDEWDRTSPEHYPTDSGDRISNHPKFTCLEWETLVSFATSRRSNVDDPLGPLFL